MKHSCQGLSWARLLCVVAIGTLAIARTSWADSEFLATQKQESTVGFVTVIIFPEAAVSAGAQWRVDGSDYWSDSGTTIGGLSVGTHEVSFRDVSGWVTPVPVSVEVQAEQTASVTGTYTEIIGMFASPERLDFSPDGGAQTFRIETTAPWSVSGDQSWVTLSPTSGTGAASVSVSCAKNKDYMRTAVITIRGSNTTPGSASVDVVQAEAPKKGMCGCLQRKDAKGVDILRRLLGDWLLAGIALMTLATLSGIGNRTDK